MSNISMMKISGKTIDLGALPFNLHLQDHRGRMILYGKKGIVITKEMKDMLIRENRSFYISSIDLDNYLDYTIDRLENIVRSKKLTNAKKSEIIRSTGRQLFQTLNKKVVDEQAIKKTRKYVEAMVELVVNNSSDYQNLLNSPQSNTYHSDHALNSSAFCVLLGIEIFGKDDESNLYILGLGGLLHDIGMAHIDQSILDKRDPLTTEERGVIELHVQMGLNQVENRELPEEVREMMLHHHERADGSGYPDGLAADEISIHTMITAVSDVYDALTTRRSFRGEQQHIQALETIFKDKHLYHENVLVALAKVVLQNPLLIKKLLGKHGIDFGQ